ncbi:MAG TPA: condensation domain-containing protein, partial [Thermoanaerobaculia bacterium]|nr:condensation domain-containing protein [Thermoanaerobaculia bacterium]
MKSEEIDDIYELSPMQAGMLFHSLAAERSGVYVLQFVCPLTGGLDETAFERAWEGLAARHAVLRTSFHWQELDKPLQVVHQKVALPLARLDWRSIPEEAQEQRLRSLLREDRVQGFDLSQVPLVRLLLIRTGDTAYRLLWTTHHILLDGWCLGLVLQELLELYDGFRRGEPVRLPPVRPYADYIEWLQSQDAAAAEAFWRRILSGFGAATRLGVDRLAAPAASDGAALDPGGEAVFAEES